MTPDRESTASVSSTSSPLPPLVSVIIVNWNGKQYIDQCLGSLAAQTYPSIETIFVDNASSDGSAAYVAEHFPKATVVANEKNLGFAGGNNSGIARATGKYICLLNNDAVAEPDWIGQLVRAGEEHPDAGMLASKVRFKTPANALNSTGTLVYPDLSCINRGMFETDSGQYERMDEVFGPYGAAALYRRQALDEVGWFDSEYFMHREEDDLTWRCRLAGWKCYYVPSAVVTHLWSASSGGGGSALKLFYGERNRVWNLFKFLPLDMVVTSLGPTVRRMLLLKKTIRPRADEVSAPARSKLTMFQIITTIAKAWFLAWLRFAHFRAKGQKVSIRGGTRRERVKDLLARFGAGLGDIARIQGIGAQG